MDIITIAVIIIALWSITKTLEKLTDKVVETQEKQTQLLEEIKKKLENESFNRDL